MKTMSAKKDEVKREWLIVDATGVPLGRLASTIAYILRGKHKPIYTPHVDTGDHVIVINADKIKVTGNKLQDKSYVRHSDYPGGFKSTTMAKRFAAKPDWVIKKAVKGMLPKNILGRAMIRKLKVYRGTEHPHEAQQPKTISLVPNRFNMIK